MIEPPAPGEGWWTTQRRARFGELADVLIPAEGVMPSASDTSVAGRGLDLVRRARPDLDQSLRVAVEDAEARPATEVVAALVAGGGVVWQALALAVAGAYYSDPEVRKLLGYPGQQARKVDPFEYTRYVAEGLLDSVVARGPCFQVAPSCCK